MNNTHTTTIFDRVMPKSIKNSVAFGSPKRNYRQLRVILLTAMLSIAITPLLMVAGLGYYYYKDLLENSEREQLEWQLDGSKKSIEHMVDRLTSVVQFAASMDLYDDLLEKQKLESLLFNIQRHYGFFADIGVVDQNGIQQAYKGPHDLQGLDYSDEEWFAEVSRGGTHISGVYTGFREIPHFSLAVRNIDPATGRFWILRATIDAAKLQRFVDAITTAASDDLFLVDDRGVLQTSSTYFGPTLSTFPGRVTDSIERTVSHSGENIFQAVSKITDTPWSLVIIKKQYIHQADWREFKYRLYVIVFFCIVTGVLVARWLVDTITDLLQKTDKLQLAMLKEAEHTEKLASIGRLAAGVGHEINNPLAIINQKAGLIDDLLEMGEDFENKNIVQDCIKSIYKSVDRCKAITHRLLGFARRTEVTTEEMQINDVLKEVLLFLENSMIYNHIKTDLQLQENLPNVNSDKLQLQQVFLNVINNAIDAIGKDGTISLSTQLVAGDIRVVIQDDGPGIDQEVLSSIFEPFFTTKEPGKGTGLGLSITYGLIKKLGGDITVRSQPGQGTAFTITIPTNGAHDEQ